MRRFLSALITVFGLCAFGVASAAVVTGTSAWSEDFAESAISTDLKYADGSPYSNRQVLMICTDVNRTFPEGPVSFITQAEDGALKGGAGAKGVAAMHWLIENYYSVYFKNRPEEEQWAFQYAVWEIGNDYNGNVNSISPTAGQSNPPTDGYFGAGGSISPNDPTFLAAYQAMYQAMTTSLPALSTTYRSTTYTIDFFKNSNADDQDMVAVIEKVRLSPPTAVPTTGEWALIALSSLLLMGGVLSINRRRN